MPDRGESPAYFLRGADLFNIATRPSDPTDQGKLKAFQDKLSNGVHVLPSSQEKSLPFVPTAIQHCEF